MLGTTRVQSASYPTTPPLAGVDFRSSSIVIGELLSGSHTAGCASTLSGDEPSSADEAYPLVLAPLRDCRSEPVACPSDGPLRRIGGLSSECPHSALTTRHSSPPSAVTCLTAATLVLHSGSL